MVLQTDNASSDGARGVHRRGKVKHAPTAGTMICFTAILLRIVRTGSTSRSGPCARTAPST